MGRADLSIRAQARESAPTTTDRVVYPTLGLITILIRDEEVRRAACRALNRMKAEMFAGFTDRLIPVATIPMHTPREAIDELDHLAPADALTGRKVIAQRGRSCARRKLVSTPTWG